MREPGRREYAECVIVIDHSWPVKHRSEYSVAQPSGFFLDFATSDALFESGLSLPAELCDWDC